MLIKKINVIVVSSHSLNRRYLSFVKRLFLIGLFFMVIFGPRQPNAYGQSSVEVLSVGGVWVSDYSPIVSSKGAVAFVDYNPSVILKLYKDGVVTTLAEPGTAPSWVSDGTNVVNVQAPYAAENGVIPFIAKVDVGAESEYEVVTYDCDRGNYKKRLSTVDLPSNVRSLGSPKILGGKLLVHVVYEDFYQPGVRHTGDMAIDLLSGTVITLFDSLFEAGPKTHWRGANLIHEYAIGVHHMSTAAIVVRELPSGSVQTILTSGIAFGGGTLLGIENPAPTDSTKIFAFGANIQMPSGSIDYTLWRLNVQTGQSMPLFLPGEVNGASRMTGSFLHVPSLHDDLENYIITVDDGGMASRSFYRITLDSSGSRSFERLLGVGDPISGHGTITSLGHGVSLTPLSDGNLTFWASTTTTSSLLGSIQVGCP